MTERAQAGRTPRRDLARRISKVLGWGALGLGILPLVMVVIGKGFGVDRPSFWGDGFLGGVWASAVASAVLAWFMGAIARGKAGRLEVNGAELRVVRGDRVWTIPASSVAGAMIVPTVPMGPVHIELLLESGEQLLVDASNWAEARALLTEAGISLEKRTARTSFAASMRAVGLLGALFGSFLAGPLCLPTGDEGILGTIMWFAVVAAMFAGTVVGTSAPEVTVGLDGLQWRSARGTRFVSFDGIVEVRPTARGLELVRADHSKQLVNFYLVATPRRQAQRDALVESVTEALEQRKSSSEEKEAMASLARAGRPVPSWREAIRELATSNDYRTVSLPFDGLARVLARADATAEDRIGAAIALKATHPEEAKERVRIAAQTCADPKVRIALERVADGTEEDAAIEEALEGAPRRAALRSR